ncbi:MAG TPA: restriction endonuclease subunit S [Marinilabiliaceae bacterium]|nr:restriction endonuclease subunit S [Marinilabiliaceae bacterium]
MVPNGWFILKLDEIVKKTQLGTSERHKGDKCQSPIPLLKMGNLNWGGFDLTSLELLPLSKVDETLLLNKGDFLFNTRNTPQLVGKSAVWNNELGKVTFDNNINKITFNGDKADSFYMGYYLNTGKGKSKIRSLSAGSTSVAAIYWKDLKNIRLELPPIREQRKIAKILSTWDKAISTTERLIDNSKQQKKALMQQLLTGKKRLFDDSGKPFEGEFDRVNLSELATIDKSSLGKKTPEDFEFSYISLSDVETGKIADNLEKHVFSSSPSRARRKVSCGDILLATVRPNLKGFAKVKAEHDGMIASTGFSVLTPKKGVSGDYLYHYLFSCHITGQINALVVGSNYPAINSSDVSGLKIYIPSYDEQKKVASVLNNADQSLAQLEQQLADLKQEKKALMQQLLTGKRRVKINNKECVA